MAKVDNVTVSVVNFNPVWGNKKANIEKMKDFVSKAVEQGAEIIVFPELALTGYSNEPDVEKEKKMQYINAETIPGPSTEEFSKLAGELAVYIIFGMPEKGSNTGNNKGVIYNSAAVCTPDARILSYRKIHLPGDESEWASKGDKPMVFDTKWGPVGLTICYDTYLYPELIRYARASGARLHINITACSRLVYNNVPLQLNLEANARMNYINIATASISGSDKINEFTGGSSIIGSSLENKKDITYYAGEPFNGPDKNTEKVYTAALDLSIVDNNMFDPVFVTNERTGTPDFRPEIYSKMYKELSESKD
jgi:predicted amidohydrolase